MRFLMRLNLFWRSFFLQTNWNYAKYQNVGLAFVMWPFLKHLYRRHKAELPQVMQRYLENFNTHPVMASFCFGALARQERKLVKKQDLETLEENLNDWEGIKRSLSITTASIGDRLFWGSLKPLTLLAALFIWLALDVNFLEIEPLPQPKAYIFIGMICAFVLFNAIALFVKWKGIQIGYMAKDGTCFGLTKFDWNQTIYHAKRIGVWLAIGMLVFAAYYALKDFNWASDFQWKMRASAISIFVLVSFITRKLRVPNIYLYLAVFVVFNIASCI